jgi:hypothetical protein
MIQRLETDDSIKLVKIFILSVKTGEIQKWQDTKKENQVVQTVDQKGQKTKLQRSAWILRLES